MPVDFVLCDVFTDRPFAGNQLAVFLGEVPDETMSSLAREFRWSEITFALPVPEGNPPRVRIWTPEGELPFAGHPTIGTAVVLASVGRIEPGEASLQLGIGEVSVEVQIDGPDGGSATMTQHSPEFGPEFGDRGRLAAAFGLEESDIAPDLPVQTVSTGLPHFLVPLASIEALERARAGSDLPVPPIGDTTIRFAYLFTTDTPGSIAAARARLIAPGMEDPGTGSAAGPLGAYLVRYGLHRAGAMEIEQGIEMGRPSRIRVDVPFEGHEIGPVRVSGDVRIWGRGSL